MQHWNGVAEEGEINNLLKVSCGSSGSIIMVYHYDNSFYFKLVRQTYSSASKQRVYYKISEVWGDQIKLKFDSETDMPTMIESISIFRNS